MRVVDGLDAVLALDLERLHGPGHMARSAVTVGVFDGVHLGHQRLIHDLLELASELDAVPTVVTFRDHPDRLLHGSAPPLIVGVQHRLRLLRRAGVQRLVLLDFEPRLRAMTAAEFARDVLVGGLSTRGLLLGFDSRLGRDREGTPERFRALGAGLGFTVRESRALVVDGEAISSTAIRDAVASGDIERASRLLGRFPSTLGEVVHGDGRGRSLGFPTANVRGEGLLPAAGVYAAQVILTGEPLPAVANVGPRPTFDGEAGAPLLEVHVLGGFARDLYGATVEVCFVERLREVRRFADATALKAQIAHDVARAQAVLEA